MIILFNDVIQYSNAPKELKSPALADYAQVQSPLTILFTSDVSISSIGIGNTDGTYFDIELNDADNTIFNIQFAGNGLYTIPRTIKTSYITIITDASYIGRLGAGLGIKIGTAIAKQPGWNSSSTPRSTLSGQVIPGAGGYNYRTLSLDTRYKLAKEAIDELIAGYKYIGQGYPFFIDLTTESYKLPYKKLYAAEESQLKWGLEGGIRGFRYSYKFNFKEAF